MTYRESCWCGATVEIPTPPPEELQYHIRHLQDFAAAWRRDHRHIEDSVDKRVDAGGDAELAGDAGGHDDGDQG